MPDYHSKIRALRAKAADPVVTPEERTSLLAKAKELEKKYGKVTEFSPRIDDTVITSRDGRWSPWAPAADFWQQVQWGVRNYSYEADYDDPNYRYQDENEDYGYEAY